MSEARPIRGDISAKELRRRVRRETNGRVASRLLALANALDGMDRGEAARRAGMDRQTLRDWVIRFDEQGIEGLRDVDEYRPLIGKTAIIEPTPPHDQVSSRAVREDQLPGHACSPRRSRTPLGQFESLRRSRLLALLSVTAGAPATLRALRLVEQFDRA